MLRQSETRVASCSVAHVGQAAADMIQDRSASGWRGVCSAAREIMSAQLPRQILVTITFNHDLTLLCLLADCILAKAESYPLTYEE